MNTEHAMKTYLHLITNVMPQLTDEQISELGFADYEEMLHVTKDLAYSKAWKIIRNILKEAHLVLNH